MPADYRFKETLYNPTWLRETYATKNAAQIAEMIGCTRGAVLDNLHKHGIPIEQRKFARHPGSHAPRPRVRFLTTLHNEAWLREHYEEKQMSALQVAHLADASVPATLRALRVAGIAIRSIGEQLQGKPNEKRRSLLPGEAALRKRARKKTPPGPCVICGEEGVDVNHRDRNPLNEDSSNLERLCRKCHHTQHAEEERIMMVMLKERGVEYIEIHAAARAVFLERRNHTT